MILTFSKNMPWRTSPGGQLIPTNFKIKTQKKEKIHTFRLGFRWKAGDVIHPYENNPRNGGKKFDMVKPYGHDKVDGTEIWRMTIDETGTGWTYVRIYINSAMSVFVKYNPFDHSLDFPYTGDDERLESIASKDGLKPSEFVRWFVHSARKAKKKELEGQIVHWTPFRHVADVAATITDS